MTAPPTIRLLATDLDNTLYDWISYFSTALTSLVEAGARLLDVPEEQLITELRDVHRTSGNTEQPYALAFTRTALVKHHDQPLEERVAALAPAFEAFDRTRQDCLTLYPGVADTLGEVRRRGVPVVGLTDAMWPNALHRLRMLGIEQHFTHLYAPTPDDAPWSDPLGAGGYPDSPVTLVRLHTAERKPSCEGLRRICRDLEVDPADALYVGDSLVRDVGMAREVGTRTAWAAFGQVRDFTLWEKVAAVTHWSEEQVASDRDATVDPDPVGPDAVLDRGFDEILEAFAFGP